MYWLLNYLLYIHCNLHEKNYNQYITAVFNQVLFISEMTEMDTVLVVVIIF